MTPQEHKEEAERLLSEGVKVVNKIALAEEERRAYAGSALRPADDEWIRRRRDDLGKKAMGIWAQAQVHATLSNGKVFVSDGRYR